MDTDQQLVSRILEGESEAFEELMKRYQQPVFTIIYRMTGKYQDSEDIAQDVFLTVYQKLYQFDQTKSFSPWLYRIAVNTCITAMRKKKKMVSITLHEDFSEQIEASYDYSRFDPQACLEQSELRELIKASIEKLPESYKTVLVLRYDMELSNQEIADILHITKDNVEVKIHRARKALRKIIMESGVKGGGSHGVSAKRSDAVPKTEG